MQAPLQHRQLIPCRSLSSLRRLRRIRSRTFSGSSHLHVFEGSSARTHDTSRRVGGLRRPTPATSCGTLYVHGPEVYPGPTRDVDVAVFRSLTICTVSIPRPDETPRLRCRVRLYIAKMIRTESVDISFFAVHNHILKPYAAAPPRRWGLFLGPCRGAAPTRACRSHLTVKPKQVLVVYEPPRHLPVYH